MPCLMEGRADRRVAMDGDPDSPLLPETAADEPLTARRSDEPDQR